MKYALIKDNKPIMRTNSVEVSLPLSSEDKATLDFMLDYLRKSHDEEYAKKHHIREGVGLAAIQIGIAKKMFVICYDDDNGNKIEYQIVNPKIIEESVKKCALSGGEGCLSVDTPHNGLVHRSYKIKMKAFDALTNKDIVISASGFDAIVLQHEYDHLFGKFFYDRINENAPNKPLENEEII